MLRAIYAPQNIYCVHVDKKSKPSIRAAITAIASCFPNVLMVSQSVDVVYASWSRVQADLNCMADLYRSSTQWKYLINLCGQDFPLKTNLEMVRMLSSLKGRNSLESVELRDSNKWRVKKIHEIVNGAIQVRHLSSLCPDYCQTGVNDGHPSNYDLFNCFRPQKRTRSRLHSICPFGQEVRILWSAEATSTAF